MSDVSNQKHIGIIIGDHPVKVIEIVGKLCRIFDFSCIFKRYAMFKGIGIDNNIICH